MHHRFRREEQHDQSGDRHRAERQHRPVEHDADEDDGDHNERALGRDLGAGQHEIERSHQQRAERRPFLDRHPVGKPGDQRQQSAQNEEHDAGDDRHVVAGDRQHVADAGDEHRVVKVRRDRVALAGDQRRRDRADIARQHRTDARIDRVTHALDECRRTQPQARLCRRRHDLDGAMHEARRADALEIKIAREIIASRPQRLQRRIKLRLRLDESAGRRRHAAANGKPHTLRLVDDAVAVDALDAQHEAIGLLALVAQFDKARDRHAVGGKAQNRMLDQRGFERRHGKAGADGEKSERENEGHRPVAQQHSGRRRNGKGGQGRPPGRLMLRGEIKNDAGAEGDREPRQQSRPAPISAAAHARMRAGTANSACGQTPFQPHGAPPTGQVRTPARARPRTRSCGYASSATARPLREATAGSRARSDLMLHEARVRVASDAMSEQTEKFSRRRRLWPRCRASRRCG